MYAVEYGIKGASRVSVKTFKEETAAKDFECSWKRSNSYWAKTLPASQSQVWVCELMPTRS